MRESVRQGQKLGNFSMRPSQPKRPRSKKEPAQTGVDEIDRLANLRPCTIQDYIAGASAYVRRQTTLAVGPKKASQIRLSNALARALAAEIETQLPQLAGRLVTEEQKVAGGLRTANADVSESHVLDGLRLAVELKPINLAVGRAIWNRFGDIRTFAVHIHLKFPFAVVGGVLVIPTYEETGTRASVAAEIAEVGEPEEILQSEDPANNRRPARPPVARGQRTSLSEQLSGSFVPGAEKAKRKPLICSKGLPSSSTILTVQPFFLTCRNLVPACGGKNSFVT